MANPMSNSSSQVSTDLLLSFSTVPLLLILVGSRAIAAAMKEMGQSSEELFRGDRLPILKISPVSLDDEKGLV
ncbi:MAG: hypothetical protein HC827_18270 [Cyanobacteria bacterium RM1_2_2]|nr:hypothetical protein [Cyanobacteria bacterium RM1_2_2]